MRFYTENGLENKGDAIKKRPVFKTSGAFL